MNLNNNVFWDLANFLTFLSCNYCCLSGVETNTGKMESMGAVHLSPGSNSKDSNQNTHSPQESPWLLPQSKLWLQNELDPISILLVPREK